MFRSGCITIIVLILLGFAFEQYWRTHICPAIAQRWASVEKQLHAAEYACPGYEFHTVLVSRLHVTGKGDVTALEKDLKEVGKIEVDENGIYIDENGDFTVVVETATNDCSHVNFAMHSIYHNGFQITECKQSSELRQIL
jgi:hypothetical protein